MWTPLPLKSALHTYLKHDLKIKAFYKLAVFLPITKTVKGGCFLLQVNLFNQLQNDQAFSQTQG